MALISCGFLLKSELKRLENAGLIHPQTITIQYSERTGWNDIFLNIFFTVFLVSKLFVIIKDVSLFSADPAGLLFSSQGNWTIGIIAGLFVGAYYYISNQKKPAGVKDQQVTFMPSEKTNDIIMLAGLSGVFGSKMFSILENLEGFFADPLGSIFSGSGLNVYGGLIVAFLFVYRYVQRIGIKPIYMMDIGGMGILLGYAVGRMGCQLSGDGDWGIVAAAQPEWWFLPDWLWSYNYPNNVNNEGIILQGCDPDIYQKALADRLTAEQRCMEACGMRYCHQLSPGVYPTPVYETIISLLGLAGLWAIRKKNLIPGTIFFIYMIFNGIERFWIETIRVNDKYEYFGVYWSQAQYLSVLFVILGAGGLVYLYRKKS
jgi:prolipoprotein diacylglyceryltransferase